MCFIEACKILIEDSHFPGSHYTDRYNRRMQISQHKKCVQVMWSTDNLKSKLDEICSTYSDLQLILVILPENTSRLRFQTNKIYREYLIVFVFAYTEKVNKFKNICILGKIKAVSEVKFGVITQCVKYETCLPARTDYRRITGIPTVYSNILLKINVKLGGINHHHSETM